MIDKENFLKTVERIGGEQLRQEFVLSGVEPDLISLPAEAVDERQSETLAGTSTGVVQSGEAPEKPGEDSLLKQIKEMTIPQKIKLALFGNQTARTILLRDSNRIIPMFVLDNPKITDNEIVEISKNNQLDEQILRSIGNNLQWMKSYQIKFNLVCNAKTPLDISLRWLKFIKDKDLRQLARSKSVPQVIASQARKMVEQKNVE